MSKFCKNCGTALVSNACPKCPKEEKQVSEIAKSVANSFFDNIKSLIKNPITTTKKLVSNEENHKFGLMVLASVTVILILAIYLIIKESYTLIAGLIALSGAESVFKLSTMGGGIPYGGIILSVASVFIVSTAILVLSVWGTHKWGFKKEVSIKNTVTFIAITYIPVGIALLLAIPVFYILPSLLVGLILLGVIAYYAMYILNIKHLSNISEDKMFYVILISFAVNFILQYIVIAKLLMGLLS